MEGTYEITRQSVCVWDYVPGRGNSTCVGPDLARSEVLASASVGEKVSGAESWVDGGLMPGNDFEQVERSQIMQNVKGLLKSLSLYPGGIGNKQGFKQGPVQSDLRLESTWLWLPPAQQPGGGWSRSRKPWLPVSCELIVVGLSQSELEGLAQ